MGRRSTHTPDELRELIVSAGTRLVLDQGLAGLSAREIARKIDYSPGTIYNVFRDLDDVIFTIENRMLTELADAIEALPPDIDTESRVSALAHTVIRFCLERPRLWCLLIEHVPNRGSAPIEFHQRFERIISAFDGIVAPLADHDATRARRVSSLLWSGLHGISTVATTSKMGLASAKTAHELAGEFVAIFVAGLKELSVPKHSQRAKKRVGAK